MFQDAPLGSRFRRLITPLFVVTALGSTTLLQFEERSYPGYTSKQTAMHFASNEAGSQGPMFSHGPTSFNGVTNSTFSLGFGGYFNGEIIDTETGKWAFQMENKYQESVGGRLLKEAYIQYNSGDGGNEARPLMIVGEIGVGSPNRHRFITRLGGQFISFGDERNAQFATKYADFQPNRFDFYGNNADVNMYLTAGASSTPTLNMGIGATTNAFQINVASTNRTDFLFAGTRRMSLYNTPNGSPGAALAVGTESNGATFTGKSNQDSLPVIRTSPNSDSATAWRVEHRNAANNSTLSGVDGRGLVVLRSYTVAALPASGNTAGNLAFATNGRKNGEGAGAGTGVMVFWDGTAWRASDTGATVQS